MQIEDKFKKTVKNGEKFYQNLEPVYCPYLNNLVHFNSSGLEHLKFKRRGRARSLKDKSMRFKLLPLVPEVLKLSRTVQGIWETRHFEKVRIHSRTDTILQEVTFYEFIAVLDGKRVKVIIKQIEDGQKFFWSIIPFWGIDKVNGRRKLHSGNLKEE